MKLRSEIYYTFGNVAPSTIGRHISTWIWLICCWCQVVSGQYLNPPKPGKGELLIACHNIKWFGARRPNLSVLASVIQEFDVYNIVEVIKPDLLKELVVVLNNQIVDSDPWYYINSHRFGTDANTYQEGYGVLWRADRITLGNGPIGTLPDPLEVYRCDPFVVSLTNRHMDLALVLFHSRWSKDVRGDRETEVRSLGSTIDGLKAEYPKHPIVVMGDFNYSISHRNMVEFMKSGRLKVVTGGIPTTFQTNGRGYANDYDHIFTTPASHPLFKKAGVFDVVDWLHPKASELDRLNINRTMSDHLPIWVLLGSTSVSPTGKVTPTTTPK